MCPSGSPIPEPAHQLLNALPGHIRQLVLSQGAAGERAVQVLPEGLQLFLRGRGLALLGSGLLQVQVGPDEGLKAAGQRRVQSEHGAG